MAIRPIDLPSAAGLEYGKGDVRHFSEGDSVSVPGLSNPTRHLAERDNQLRDKLNEVISIVNNTEQFVPLPVVRTSLPPNDEVVVANYRIPAGFEARVLNASVATVPSSVDIALVLYYNTGFGGSTGTEVISTASEFTGGVQFYSEGEFIVVLRNTGAVSLDFAASVLLTLRPLGAQGTLLVGSTVVGPQGLPGPAGPVGPAGPAGSGGPGTPGMVWRNGWAPGENYGVSDVVSYTTFGTVVSSYICLQAHLSTGGGDEPPVDVVKWEPVAVGGTGPIGAAGSSGAPGTSAEIPVYDATVVQGTLLTGDDWQGLGIDGYNGGGSVANTTYYFSLNEVFIESSTGAPKGFACLTGNYPIAMRGSGTITLPKAAYGAKVNYTNGYIQLNAIANGTVPIEIIGVGSYARLTTSIIKSTDQYVVKVLCNDPVMTMFTVNGVQPIF